MLELDETLEILEKAKRDRTVKLKASRYFSPNPPGPPHWWQEIQTLHIVAKKLHMVGDLTGLGKTPEVLRAYAILKEKYPNLKLWVLASKSATVTWQEQIPLWTVGLKYIRTPSERVALSKLPKAERSKWRGLNSTAFRDAYAYKPWKDHGDILITNYEQAQRDWKTVVVGLAKEDLMIAADEASHFSHEDTDLYQQILEIREHADRFYPMSATIAKNNLNEARAIIAVMNKEVCPLVTFQSYFCKYKSQWIKNPRTGRRYKIQVLDGYKNEEHFKKMIQPWYLGYRDDDPDVAKHLPKIQNKRIQVDISSEMRKAYDAIEDNIVNPEWGKEMTPLTKLLYAQMFVNAPVLIKDKFPTIKSELEKCAKETPPKLRELHDLLNNELQKEAVLVYSHWERTVSLIHTYLQAKGFKVGRITGKEDDEQRAEAREKLQRGELQVLVIDDAGGESLNMQAAKAIIFYDLPWSAGDYIQAVGRIRRLMGGANKLVYHLMVPDSIDHYKWEVLERKFLVLERLYGGRGDLLKNDGGESHPVGDGLGDGMISEVLEEMRRRKGVLSGNTQDRPEDGVMEENSGILETDKTGTVSGRSVT